MKVSLSLAVCVIACAPGFAASSNPVQKEKNNSSAERGPVPCLLGTDKCSTRNNPPVSACLVGANSTGSCPVDGFKVTQAGLR